VCAIAVVAIRRSGLGERLLAMKDSPAACATLGLNVTMTKLLVFSMSAAMAGVGGAIYGGTAGTVTADRFSFFESLPLLLLAVVGGIGAVGGAMFAGLVLYGLPLAAASVAWFANPARVLPGTMGIGLGSNPNGVVPDLAARFEPLRRSRLVQVGLGITLALLVALQRLEVLDSWPFAILCVFAIFAAPVVADLLTSQRAEAEPPLEWAGVTRPFSEDEIRTLERSTA
jgi:branched-chain amino acid transport system permease protein